MHMALYLMLAGGLILLIVGGEIMVRGAVATAERLSVSPLMIGVVIVGFGTSMPEMVTSVEASLAGAPGIAIGNIVGSNIANILLVLGISALLAPIAVNRQAANRDGWFALGSTLVFVAIGYLTLLDRVAGIALILGLILYIWSVYQGERKSYVPAADSRTGQTPETGTLDPKACASEVASLAVRPQFVMPIGLTLIGLITLIIGGKLLVDGARGIALEAGVSETIIGLTIVAIGTSLPEMVTCIIAALRRHGDVALGNILGSCIYNLLAIGGVTAIISPTLIPPEIVRFDNLVMLAATIAMLLFVQAGTRIGRLQGALLLMGYVGYIIWLWPK
jgi:cation:H+ antiporter